MKITPAHDFNDHAMGERHALSAPVILDENACLCGRTPAPFHGLSASLHGKKLWRALSEMGVLEAMKSHVHAVPVSERSGEVD